MTYQLSPDDKARCDQITSRHNRRVREVVGAVCAEVGLPVSAIYGKSRVRNIAMARRLVCYILRREGMSLPQIGAALGLDHTSVLHAVRMEAKARAESETPTD